MISAVLDVNVIVSSVMSPLGAPRRVLVAWENGEIVALTSTGIIEVTNSAARARNTLPCAERTSFPLRATLRLPGGPL